MGKLANLTKEEKMRMLHTVRLMDYGTPSFCSGTAVYMGYIDAIKKVINKLDKDNRLVYNWREDKRFELLVKKEQGLEVDQTEYNKQKALYYRKNKRWPK